jgi:hypothetical protein
MLRGSLLRQNTLVKYRGSCHCGSIRYEVEGDLTGSDGLQLLDVQS